MSIFLVFCTHVYSLTVLYMHCIVSILHKNLRWQPNLSACVLFYLLLAGGAVSGFTPVTYPATVSSECGQYDLLQDQQLIETLGHAQQQLGPPGCNPPKNKSCQEILYCFPSAPSGYYQIRVPNGSLVQFYCDMEGTNCGGEGGWTRVAYVNMSQSGATCPQGLTQTTISRLTLCGRNGPAGCQSTVFSTVGLNYSQVCGQLRGYQRGTPDCFRPYYDNPSQTIDSVYVDGVSITYSSAPRKHIWTYANGLNLVYANPQEHCPCNIGNSIVPPPFVGQGCHNENNLVYVDSLVVVHTLLVWRTLCSDILQDHSGHRESVLRWLSVSVPEGRWHRTVTC